MKTPGKLTGKSVALLVGMEALDLYLKEIGWNLRTLMGQADVLETAILEMKKQLRERIATEPTAAHPNSARSNVSNPAVT